MFLPLLPVEGHYLLERVAEWQIDVNPILKPFHVLNNKIQRYWIQASTRCGGSSMCYLGLTKRVFGPLRIVLFRNHGHVARHSVAVEQDGRQLLQRHGFSAELSQTSTGANGDAE